MTFIRFSKGLCPKNVYELSLWIVSSPMLKDELCLKTYQKRQTEYMPSEATASSSGQQEEPYI